MNIEIKSKMMQLWKDTFHDSDEYISMVFENYFDDDRVEFEVQSGALLSAMLSVGYEFEGAGMSRPLRGLYLCGLATVPSARGAGLMSQLMSRIESKARDEGFDFTFLIPADAGLRRYYADRGYADSCWRLPVRFAPRHDFKLPKGENADENCGKCELKILDFRGSYASRFDENKIVSLAQKLSTVPVGEVSKSPAPTDKSTRAQVCELRHSASDWRAVLMDLKLSEGLFLWLEQNDEVVAYCYVGDLNDSFLSANGSHSTESRSAEKVSKFTVKTDKITYEDIEEAGSIQSSEAVSDVKNGRQQVHSSQSCVHLHEDVKVRRIFCRDGNVEFANRLMAGLQGLFPDSDLVLSLPQSQAGLFGDGGVMSQFYGRKDFAADGYQDMSSVDTANSVTKRLESFAMVKYLAPCEILKKLTNDAGVQKYSILSDLGKLENFAASAEFAAMLARKRTPDDYVALATDLPLLDLDAYLLLE